MQTMPRGGDFEAWVDLLARPRRRQQARHHLMSIGRRALPALRRGLHHPDAAVRRACTSILDSVMDQDSVGDLVAALDDVDASVRRRALHALACDGCKQDDCRPGEHLWVPLALDMLHDEDPDIRAGAIDALGKIVARRPDVAIALADVVARDADNGLRSMARGRISRH